MQGTDCYGLKSYLMYLRKHVVFLCSWKRRYIAEKGYERVGVNKREPELRCYGSQNLTGTFLLSTGEEIVTLLLLNITI